MKEAEEVDFKSLKTNTKKYENKLISIKGFYILSFENVALYQTKYDADNFNTNKGIWINDTLSNEKLEKLKNSYVRVSGIFSTKRKGHLNQYIGTIDSACIDWD
jgi:hypothetical protein